MEQLITEMMEHICDDLCRYPGELGDQDELDRICAECKLGGYVCSILNRIEVECEAVNVALTLKELRTMDGEPVWIEVLDRLDLSRWHFIVRTETLGLIAKDGLGQYECYPHNEDKLIFSGCYFDVEKGHGYGVKWLAYKHRLVR